MQIKITIKLAMPLTLPINYNHIMQGVVYSLLSGDEGIGSSVHDIGYQYNNKAFRMFVFSDLRGRYSIEGKRITFFDSVEFEIRSPQNLFIVKIAESLKEMKLRLGNAEIEAVNIEIKDTIIASSACEISTRTPVAIYANDISTKKKDYKNPYDPDFYELLKNNFVRKYAAFYGDYPKTGIEIKPVEHCNYKKRVTYYNNAPVEGWSGTFYLEGDPAYINFLYNAGLGSKNPIGFGMFDAVNR